MFALIALLVSSECVLNQAARGQSFTPPLTAVNLDPDCAYLGQQGIAYDGPGTYQKSYDTLRLFVEHCYDYPDSEVSWLGVFGSIGGAASGVASTDQSVWPDFRAWLKKVLYYNRDTSYYCGDVNEILSTYAYPSQDDAAAIGSVVKYILESGKCPMLTQDYQKQLSTELYWRHKLWADSMALFGYDTTANPYDFSLPTIDVLGLGLLRGNPNSIVHSTSISSPSLLSVTALNNPFNSSLEVNCEMGR